MWFWTNKFRPVIFVFVSLLMNWMFPKTFNNVIVLLRKIKSFPLQQIFFCSKEIGIHWQWSIRMIEISLVKLGNWFPSKRKTLLKILFVFISVPFSLIHVVSSSSFCNTSRSFEQTRLWTTLKAKLIFLLYSHVGNIIVVILLEFSTY
jgi:hypothetical protein